MPHTFDDAFAVVKSLAKDFAANKGHFLSPSCQESEVRIDFIDKFLIALGWDANHDWQKNPFEQEVKVERGVNMHVSPRSFRPPKRGRGRRSAPSLPKGSAGLDSP